MGKNTTEIFTTGTCVFSFVGAFGSKILKLFGAVDFAMRLDEFMAIYTNPNISWNALYMWVFLICVTFLSYKYLPVFLRYIDSVREEKIIEPDMSIKEALLYIVNESNFGKSLQRNQYGRDDAVKALKSLLLSGKLILFGTDESNPNPHEIKSSEFNNENLLIKFIELRNQGLVEISYVSNDNDGNEKIKNLAVSKKQLTKIYSHKYGYYR